MEIYSSIDLADGSTTTASFTVDDGIMTVQVAYANIDGDFEVAPLQSNDGSTWDPIFDFNGIPVIWNVKHQVKASLQSGDRMFQIPDGLHVVSCKLKVTPVGGKLGATEGIVTLTVKNTLVEV